jgi:hypothetical protein
LKVFCVDGRNSPVDLTEETFMEALRAGAGSPLRQRMITDMELAGLASRTQQNYIGAVRRLAAHYRRSPDRLNEEEVRAYLLALRDRGAARGTFKIVYHGIKFLYCQTLDCDWPLFVKKRFGSPSRSGCPMPCPTRRFASF